MFLTTGINAIINYQTKKARNLHLSTKCIFLAFMLLHINGAIFQYYYRP
jgi:hypothetical protein